MKSYKVYLNVYDFTSCNSCLSIVGLGGYHTGIEIEYLLVYLAISNIVIVWFLQIHKKAESLLSNPKVQIFNLIVNYFLVKLV